MTCAQPDTATFKALNPDWQHTLEVEFLRSIEFTNRWAQWAQTADATGDTPRPARKQPRNIPKPVPLPWDPKPKEEPKPTAMTIAEANKWLGWTKPGEAVDGG